MTVQMRNKTCETTTNDWNDWKWQMRNRITETNELSSLLSISELEERHITHAAEFFPMAVTPYYASLIDPDDTACPIRRQAIPCVKEMNFSRQDMIDPLHEDKDAPVQGLTHRYPDRVLLLATNECAMYCRHCTRKRKVGDAESSVESTSIHKGIEYIRNNPRIRDVLISGGDPLILDTEVLERIISNIKRIRHVEIIRIGTRTPVVLPQRITRELTNMLKKYHPIWINTHFNHPAEFTPESENALALLADAGIPLGNQSVLLRGINDCPEVMKKLLHLLLKNRVRPYYIYQCDLSRGIEHFRTPISTGIRIIEQLIGHTSGLAVPRYIVDAPGGGGKIPVQPNYLISYTPDRTILRNYEGVITSYREPSDYTSPEENHRENCSKNCNLCRRFGQEDNEAPYQPIGLEKLLDDRNDQVSLIPQGNIRHRRFLEKNKNKQRTALANLV